MDLILLGSSRYSLALHGSTVPRRGVDTVASASGYQRAQRRRRGHRTLRRTVMEMPGKDGPRPRPMLAVFPMKWRVGSVHLGGGFGSGGVRACLATRG